MSEKLPSAQLMVGRSMAPSDLPASRQAAQPNAAANEWERVLWSKTAPVLQQPIEEARPFGRRERTPVLLKWIRLLWAYRWSNRRAERIRQDVRETRSNVTAFLSMAQYAIDLAVKSEPYPEARTAKRRELMNRWRNTYERAFGRTIRL